jgi:hypothetical protein
MRRHKGPNARVCRSARIVRAQPFASIVSRMVDTLITSHGVRQKQVILPSPLFYASHG